MPFGSRLHEARTRAGLTLEELANKIGKSKSTVQRYESGEVSKLENSLIVAIADALNISPIYLMGWTDQLSNNTVLIPVLGSIACNKSITAEKNIDGYRETLKSSVPSGNLFYLKAKDNSMFPNIPTGSYVMAREQSDVKSGEIAAVLVNDDKEATLKRVRKLGDNILLEAINEEYAPYLVNEDHPARIIGKAVKLEVDL